MSKVFEALRQLEMDTGGLAASFSREAREILRQPILIQKKTNREVKELVQPAVPRSSDEPKSSARILPVRVTMDSPLMPFEPSFANVGEQYRIIRTKIVQHPIAPRVIAISSVDPGDGKTTTAINMAAALALKTETKVLLVDCDLRRGQIGGLLGIPNLPGLTDTLLGTSSLSGAIVQVEQYPNLFVLASGAVLANPTEVLDSGHWRLLMDKLRKDFDYVILDTPPIGLIADTELIRQVSDGVILVVRPDFTTRSRCLSTLTNMSGKGLLGVVLNAVQEPYLGKDAYYSYVPPAGT